MLDTDFFSTYMLPAVLAFIMFGMGLSLTVKDFQHVFLYPKDITVGLIGQLILLPAVAFGLAYVSGLRPEFQVGIMIVAACPGGAVSNLITHLVRAKVALSVSMTAINSLVTPFTIPLLLTLALYVFMGNEREVGLPFWETVRNVFFTTLLPCAIGIYVRYQRQNLAEKLQVPLDYVMPTLLAIAMIASIFLEEGDASADLDFEQYLRLSPVMLALNLIALLGGYQLARLLGLDEGSQITIGIEVSLLNTGLAIFVATAGQMLDNQAMAGPAVVYALFTFFSAAGFGIYVKRELLFRIWKRRWQQLKRQGRKDES